VSQNEKVHGIGRMLKIQMNSYWNGWKNSVNQYVREL